MPTAAQISPKQEARKGILKSPPVRDEPVPKIPKKEVQIDLSDDNVGADVLGVPPPLPSEFGGSVSHVPPGFCPEERRENPVAWTGNIQDPSKDGAGTGGSGVSAGGYGGRGISVNREVKRRRIQFF